MKPSQIFYIILFFVLSSCSTPFDSIKWKTKGNEYERIEQIETLCENYLTKGDSREKIISILGEPDLQCDSTNTLYGAFQKQVPFDNLNQELITSCKEKYNRLIHTNCSDTLTIDRYIIGNNGSGPDYILLCYSKDWEQKP